MAATNNRTENNMHLGGGGGAGEPLEKDFSKYCAVAGTAEHDTETRCVGNGYHMDGDIEPENALNRIRTAGSISISPELFEKLYLSPQNKVSGDLRKTFGNPTPM